VPFASLSLYLKMGSRYEEATERGVSHFVKHLAFTRTQTRSPVRVCRDMELATASFNATATREHIAWSAQLLSDKVGDVTWMLSDLLKVVLPEYKVRDIAECVRGEVAGAQADAATFLFEALHREAFRDVGLGNSLHCPPFRLDAIDPAALSAFLARRLVPSNLLLVGVGVKHDLLAAQADHYFSSLPSSSSAPTSSGSSGAAQSGRSAYHGGEVRVLGDGNTRLAIAFEGLSVGDKDAPALHALTSLLGGGLRHSRDGPGRGVRSRLFRNVLEQEEAVLAVSTIQASYSDTGLWGVYAEALPGRVSRVAELLATEVGKVAEGSFDEAEVQRAKAQAKACLLRETDTRAGLSNYIAQHVSSGASFVAPSALASKIDAVSKSDLAQLAKRLVKAEPTVVCTGDVVGLPKRNELRSKWTR